MPLFVSPLYLFHLFITPDSYLPCFFRAGFARLRKAHGRSTLIDLIDFHENCFSTGFWPLVNHVMLLFLCSPHLLVQGFERGNTAEEIRGYFGADK